MLPHTGKLQKTARGIPGRALQSPYKRKEVNKIKQFQFNRWIDAMQPSASVVQMEKARSMIAQGMDIINLAGGEPDFNTPVPVTYRAFEELVRGNTHYVAGAGLLPLRERIARYLLEKNGIPCAANQILVTPGGKFAIYLAVRAMLNPGDEVIVLEPSWVSYSAIVQSAGAVAVPAVLRYEEQYAITRGVLEAALTKRTRMLIVNTPNNPTGRMITRGEASLLLDFAQANGLVILSDEIYSELAYDGNCHISLASLPGGMDSVITVNGLSKSAAMTGWRIGYLCMHEEIFRRVMKLYQHTMTCVSGFSQEAATAAFDCTAELAGMREAYATRRSAFIGALQAISGVDVRLPDGAFYAWVRIQKDGMDSIALCDYLLSRAGVAGVPGAAFGGGTEGCVRLSFASKMADLERAAQRIATAIEG